MTSMHPVVRIAAEEWRYWRRSKLASVVLVVTLLLIVTSVVATNAQLNAAAAARTQLQASAEKAFREQPARHPHRMVHYGHYVFRTPAPLAVLDPGVDFHTGTAIFLEGHKQNSATFAPFYSSAHAGPLATLTPALAYQLLAPLLLIVMGFAMFSREREANTDHLLLTTSITPLQLWFGKTLALSSCALVTLLPLAFAVIPVWLGGESGMSSLAFLVGYAAYLLCWVLIVAAISSWCKRSTSSLLLGLVCWVVICLWAPRVVASVASSWAPLKSKVQYDLEVARAIRDQGDGHNASDPNFDQLRAQLLAQYEVDDVEQLPINFRGVVAETAEANLTVLLNRFADERHEQERIQLQIANWLSVFSPLLTVKSFSAIVAGTDLRQHHQFLRDAEAARFDIVQKLNHMHAHQLSYDDDINRSTDAQSEQRARIGAENWRMLEDFSWTPTDATTRVIDSASQLLLLALWMAVFGVFGVIGTARATREQR